MGKKSTRIKTCGRFVKEQYINCCSTIQLLNQLTLLSSIYHKLFSYLHTAEAVPAPVHHPRLLLRRVLVRRPSYRRRRGAGHRGHGPAPAGGRGRVRTLRGVLHQDGPRLSCPGAGGRKDGSGGVRAGTGLGHAHSRR